VRSRLDDGGLAAPRSRPPATLGRRRGHCDVFEQLDLAGQHLGHDSAGHCQQLGNTEARPLGTVTEADLLANLEFHGGTDAVPIFGGAAARRRWRKASACRPHRKPGAG
jgi:hypothetical protein